MCSITYFPKEKSDYNLTSNKDDKVERPSTFLPLGNQIVIIPVVAIVVCLMLVERSLKTQIDFEIPTSHCPESKLSKLANGGPIIVLELMIFHLPECPAIKEVTFGGSI